MWRLTVTFLFFALSSTDIYACDIQPKYLEDEEPLFTVGPKDLIQASSSILMGKFSSETTEKYMSFKIKKAFKSRKAIKRNSSVEVTFAEVKNYFVETGKDITENLDAQLLEANLKYGGQSDGGWGGPLAGIFHMTDCERSVFIYTDQQYLIILDSNNTVKALFPATKDVKELIPALKDKLASLPHKQQIK